MPATQIWKSEKRCRFLKKCTEKGLPMNIKRQMSGQMAGRPDEEKELLAEKFIELMDAGKITPETKQVPKVEL